MAVIAGADPASGKLAVVMDDDGQVTKHCWKSTSKKWEPANCAEVHRWVQREFMDLHCGDLFLEAPVVGRGGAHATIVQAFVSGAVQAAFLELGWRVHLVNVQRWKKHVAGTGRADKDDVERALADVWPVGWDAADGDADLIDAAAIAVYGAALQAEGRQVA